jgi:uncharacterized protein involved in outer membrane biogenesis
MKKFLVFLLVIVVLVAVVFSFVKNSIAKSAIESGVKSATGLDMKLKSVNVGILRSLVDLKGIELSNPKEFKGTTLAKIPRIYVDCDLGAFIRKEIHLQEVRLEIEELLIVKNAEGDLNVDVFKSIATPKEKEPSQSEKKSDTKTPEKKEEKSEEPLQFSIDLLALKLGRIIYKDYTGGAEPTTTVIKLNIDEQYENITDFKDLIRMVVQKSFVSGIMGAFGGFESGSFGQQTDKMQEKLKTLSEDMSKDIEESTEELEEEFDKIEDQFKGEIDKLEDTFKGMFKTE